MVAKMVGLKWLVGVDGIHQVNLPLFFVRESGRGGMGRVLLDDMFFCFSWGILVYLDPE